MHKILSLFALNIIIIIVINIRHYKNNYYNISINLFFILIYLIMLNTWIAYILICRSNNNNNNNNIKILIMQYLCLVKINILI